VEHEAAVRSLERHIQLLAEREPISVTPLESLITAALDRMREDIDLFLALIANPYYTRSVGRNSFHVAGLALAIGAYLGLDQRALSELGLGCALHDVGMLALEDNCHLRKRRLGPAEFVSITNHPIHTMTALKPYFSQLPPASRMVAYQTHERCDGSGYPRGRTADQIHDLAKIAAVADSFIAMVSPRPHRDGIVPYYAIKSLLRDVQLGMYDSRAVRGLLHAVSLFPIGSMVGLTPRLIGRVIRSNVEQYDKPIVELWDIKKPNATPTVVDLRECDMAIAEAIDARTTDAQWKGLFEPEQVRDTPAG
jgi:HD-GYP domain-containing protein (c-di-GMP phosphodiesterase class II)